MDTNELKEIAAAATQGIWVDQPRGRAITVGSSTLCEVFSGSVGIEQADANGRFIAAFCPEVASGLLAEIDRLKQENRLLTEHNEFLASSDSRLAPDLRAVKDALGLDFTASVSGEVVPLIERLRKLPTCWSEVLEQSEANDQLLDQLLELSADADRYRFIVDCPIRTMVALSRRATEADFDLSAECDQLMSKIAARAK